MKMKQVISGVYMMGGILGTGILGANIYFVIDEEVTVVDTGYKGREKKVIDEIE